MAIIRIIIIKIMTITIIITKTIPGPKPHQILVRAIPSTSEQIKVSHITVQRQ